LRWANPFFGLGFTQPHDFGITLGNQPNLGFKDKVE